MKQTKTIEENKIYCWECNKIVDFYEKRFINRHEKYCSICHLLLDTINYIKLSIYDSKKLGKNKCWYCKCELNQINKTSDHFFPRYMGGRLKVVCCKNCNQEKKDLTPNGFIEHLKKLKNKYPDYQPWQKRFDRMINATQTLWERVKWSI